MKWLAAILLLPCLCTAQVVRLGCETTAFGCPMVTLTVVMNGTGTGAVIDCGPGPWVIGTVETCLAIPNPGNVFGGWSSTSAIGQWGMQNGKKISGMMAVNVVLTATFTALLPAPTGVNGTVTQGLLSFPGTLTRRLHENENALSFEHVYGAGAWLSWSASADSAL